MPLQGAKQVFCSRIRPAALIGPLPVKFPKGRVERIFPFLLRQLMQHQVCFTREVGPVGMQQVMFLFLVTAVDIIYPPVVIKNGVVPFSIIFFFHDR